MGIYFLHITIGLLILCIKLDLSARFLYKLYVNQKEKIIVYYFLKEFCLTYFINNIFY